MAAGGNRGEGSEQSWRMLSPRVGTVSCITQGRAAVGSSASPQHRVGHLRPRARVGCVRGCDRTDLEGAKDAAGVGKGASLRDSRWQRIGWRRDDEDGVQRQSRLRCRTRSIEPEQTQSRAEQSRAAPPPAPRRPAPPRPSAQPGLSHPVCCAVWLAGALGRSRAALTTRHSSSLLLPVVPAASSPSRVPASPRPADRTIDAIRSIRRA